MDIVVWLRSLGLERYEAVFRENEITERVLPSLTAEDLKELGITALGHRRMLLDAVAALRADASGKAPSADVATAPANSGDLPPSRRMFAGAQPPQQGQGAEGVRDRARRRAAARCNAF
jgi:SAM domain (Sterile alpha motif)